MQPVPFVTLKEFDDHKLKEIIVHFMGQSHHKKENWLQGKRKAKDMTVAKMEQKRACRLLLGGEMF